VTMGAMPTIAALHAAGELSTRARNALTNDGGCETLADVAAMTEENVRRLANVGAGTVAEIKSVLSANGLAFATESLEIEKEEDGLHFEANWWLITTPWRDLRMMVRAIEKGIRCLGKRPCQLCLPSRRNHQSQEQT
jgi:Bacterial RNA polymerase, alpha chain C terminal domain